MADAGFITSGALKGLTQTISDGRYRLNTEKVYGALIKASGG